MYEHNLRIKSKYLYSVDLFACSNNSNIEVSYQIHSPGKYSKYKIPGRKR